MKRLCLLILCLILSFTLFACTGRNAQPQQVPEAPDAATGTTDATAQVTAPQITYPTAPSSTAYTFPAGTVICKTNVGGMTCAEAYAAIVPTLESYTLDLSVNGTHVALTGSYIGLTCSEDAVSSYAATLEEGSDPSGIQLLTYNTEAIRVKLASSVNVAPKNASIRYDSSIDKFVLKDEEPGSSIDINAVINQVAPVLQQMGTSLSVTVDKKEEVPEILADSSEAKAALKEANDYLAVSLTYSYTPDGGSTSYDTLSKDTIGGLISFDDELGSYISSNALSRYVNSMNEKYGVNGIEGQFKTTGGYYIGINVTYAGQPVDTDALADDIRHCLENKISGTRTAPYLDAVMLEDMAFGGTYVEINLSAQHLWMYKNGSCVVSTPIVSGCAYYHWNTPTGVYSIYNRKAGATLVGDNYATWVNYWMPFYGGYGLHDAGWRSTFGGDEYLYNGSHGCINIPPSAAASIFNYISVGTKVILYGGATSAEPVEQQINGTTSYEVDMGAAPFTLDAALAYGEGEMTYTSDNPEVVTVSEDGTVTVVGPGTANITVFAPEREYYTSATLTVTVNVKYPCGGNHDFGEWSISKEPTCAEGEESRSCICGETETRPVAPIAEHSFNEWSTTKEPSCAEGEQSRACSVCGHVETQSLSPIAEHSFSEWTTSQEPGCETLGKKAHTCSGCGHTETESIPATGHDFSGGQQTCGNGCGTAAPITPPPEEETDPIPAE